MDEIPRDQIGYMQVKFKILVDGKVYDDFAVNAFDECHIVDRELTYAHHQVLDDSAQVYEKIFQLELTFKETDYRVTMHMPIHASRNWEHLGEFGEYDIYFYCILGANNNDMTPNKNKNDAPSAWTRLARQFCRRYT